MYICSYVCSYIYTYIILARFLNEKKLIKEKKLIHLPGRRNALFRKI